MCVRARVCMCVCLCALKSSLEYVSAHAVNEMKFTNTQLHRI